MQKSGKTAVIVSFLIVLILIMAFVFAKPTRGIAECKDGIDNDGDNYTDWPDDPGCSSKNDKTETNAEIECDDGSDNDEDSAIDMADGGCSSPTDDDETNCGDSVCEGGETYVTCPEDCPVPDSCNDTDGGNYPSIFGTTSGYLNETPYSNDDYCVDSSSIMEYRCSGDYEQSQQYSCGTDGYGNNTCIGGDVYRYYTDYFCANGECNSTVTPELVEECDYGCTNGECDPIPDSCNDTDGGWVLEVQGTVSGYDDEEWYENTDYCVDNATVMEYYCGGNDPYNWSIPCSNVSGYCSNGACVV